ncbi:MAG: hypothetical protein HY583_03705, partial [Candidatus Omnitrophica bacterium]|nr:hypothetical protein [Candidatus Omnitrophota bacterium]
GDLTAARFDQTLRFDVKIIPYAGDDRWVEKAIIDAHKCLTDSAIPSPNPDCDYCLYRQCANEVSNTK